MTTVRFTEEDRDGRGFIRLSPPEQPEAAPEAAAPRLRPARPAAPARPPLSPRLRYQLTMAASSTAGLLLVLATMRMSLPRAIAPAVPTSVSVMTVPTRAPVPTVPPVVMLPAYAAPNGDQLGQIEATRAITPTAHFGADWIQADVAGSGRIWLRATDWPALPIIGPDLAPRPTATARPYVSPTPEPQPPCAEAGIPGKMVRVCDWLDPDQLNAAAQAKWLATYGGNVGTVTTATPYVECFDHGKYLICGGATP